MRSIKIFLLLVFAVGSLVACGGTSAAPTAESSEQTAPESTESSSLPNSNMQVVSNAMIFYDSFAEWCGTCRLNAPIIDNLEEDFAGNITFVTLNVDKPEDTPTREKFSITDRSQYVLIDQAGNVLKRWYGMLDEEAVAAELEAFVTLTTQ